MAADEAPGMRPSVLDEALADAAEALRSDGFRLEWTTDPEKRVSFVIRPDDAACEDCLVPKPVLEAMFSQALGGSGFTVGEVQTPAGL